MIDGHFKARLDRFWDHAGRALARTGLTANQVTLIGTALVLLHCALYPWHRSAIAFGLGLAILEEADNLDGAVARVTGTSSKLGAYLDATTDRYKDIAAIGVVGWVHDAHAAAFLAATGALLTSYHKARAGMEVAIDNAAWPDLFERLERIALLALGLVIAGLAPQGRLLGVDVAVATLWMLAVGSHLTGLQRLRRGARILDGS